MLTAGDEQRHCDPCSAELREVKAPEEHVGLSRLVHAAWCADAVTHTDEILS